MVRKTLVRPEIEEYNNFELYDQEGSKSAWDYAVDVATVVGACASVVGAIAAVYAACT